MQQKCATAHSQTHTHKADSPTSIYYNKVSHTLYKHFITDTLLVQGWTLVLYIGPGIIPQIVMLSYLIDTIASHSCCSFVSSTPMMWISPSSTSQRCPIWLRSNDCDGHLSTVNSLLFSRKQMIWALWHGELTCWKQSPEDGYTVIIKVWTWSGTIQV